LLNNEEDYMHTDTLENWKHDHTFGQELKKPGENRTWIVIALTGSMMVIEIIAGIIFGSMALLADGLHMASHAVALAINAFAYLYARRHAADSRFSFGTGKVNALGGFTGAILLAGFAAFMAFESIERLFNPVEIQFMNAIIVAGIGLAVNGASVFILGDHHGHDHDHDHDHHHGHSHDHDHNLRSAYFHVLADALTSFTAIFALLAGKYLGAAWMDPVMGIVGSLLVANWSRGLLRDTSRVLLDRQVDEEVRKKVVQSIEQLGDEKVADLHLWSIGPNIYNANLALVTHNPKSPDYYKEQLPDDIGVVHSTIEVHRCE
jgi:cation diffusion facilitator family transporter